MNSLLDMKDKMIKDQLVTAAAAVQPVIAGHPYPLAAGAFPGAPGYGYGGYGGYLGGGPFGAAYNPAAYSMASHYAIHNAT